MNVASDARMSSTYMPAAPMAARCHLLGSIHESETLQYRQGVSTRNITPISWHSPPKCLHDSPCPNSCRTLVTARARPSQSQFFGPEELVERRQLRLKHVELDQHQTQRRNGQHQAAGPASTVEKNHAVQG